MSPGTFIFLKRRIAETSLLGFLTKCKFCIGTRVLFCPLFARRISPSPGIAGTLISTAPRLSPKRVCLASSRARCPLRRLRSFAQVCDLFFSYFLLIINFFKGIAFTLEHGFMKTERGRQNYRYGLRQIAVAVNETNNADVILALITCENANR